MRFVWRQLVAVLLLGTVALLAPSLVSHGHGHGARLVDVGCARCALAHGAAPAAARADQASTPLRWSEPTCAVAAARLLATERTAAVPRGPPSPSL